MFKHSLSHNDANSQKEKEKKKLHFLYLIQCNELNSMLSVVH